MLGSFFVKNIEISRKKNIIIDEPGVRNAEMDDDPIPLSDLGNASVESAK